MIRRAALAAARAAFRLGDQALVRRHWSSDRTQVFILGLPRSGTTLVYQYVVHRLDVAYFTNGTGRFPSGACSVTLLQRAFHRRYTSDFVSSYGKVAGAVAPREAGAFWGRFFDLHAYDDCGRDARSEERLRRSIACLQTCLGDVPFVNKNVKHMLWLPRLAEIFPLARFVVVTRDPLHVGLSMLDAWKSQLAVPGEWWSVRPCDYEELLSLPLHIRVARQVERLQARLTVDLAHLPAARVIHVGYEDFCRNPEGLIDHLAAVCGTSVRNAPAGPFAVRTRSASSPDELGLAEALSSALPAAHADARVTRGPS